MCEENKVLSWVYRLDLARQTFHVVNTHLYTSQNMTYMNHWIVTIIT